MVIVKAKTVNGRTEIFQTESYVVCQKKDLHPDLLDVKVYAGSKCVKHVKRHFQWFYKKFLYRPLQTELKPEGAPEEGTNPQT